MTLTKEKTNELSKQTSMKSSEEKVSYCIGLETGRNLKQQFSDMDMGLFIEGINDGVLGTAAKLPQDEIKNLMAAFKQHVEIQQKQFIAQVAIDNKRAGEKFMDENKRKEGITTLPSGLQYKVLSKGTGPSPTIFDTVATHYIGSSITGHVFENTYVAGKPATFAINRAIQGWAEALQKMKVGDKWKLFIPSYLAYGEAGYGNVIGPNVPLIFEMELLAVNP